MKPWEFKASPGGSCLRSRLMRVLNLMPLESDCLVRDNPFFFLHVNRLGFTFRLLIRLAFDVPPSPST